ncbi:hypothetical protein F0562_030050 [Nyssa sinensis]|uniref:Protein arginine N-methyltransferase PRMT10 n=2 Tax=Magnoliopsida TaxID=3398 RepID=A0A5J5AZW5_9ASTE|nr:hypothetical protein F0562_030050 [Nyssa sinensis]
MGGSANGVAGDLTATSNGSATVDKSVDFANYFCTYGFLYHQKEMLCDRVRMDAYFNAIFENKHHFHGKTVLDVGTGSGILAIWSAQAGARKVYAVEATKMSEHARELVKANNLQDVVEVIEGSMEDVTLPEKVDVIISEWMGYFLLRESMFDSVICARDRWLKPTGAMYPSHARMWLAPIRSGLGDQKTSDYEGAMDDWFCFLNETKTYYGVDMSVLTMPYSEEQRKYYLQTSLWNNLHPNQVIGTAAIIKEIDCLTATVNDILNIRASIASSITAENTRLCGFSGWFDVHFRGSTENPAQNEIQLTTAPSEDYSTHWGQQVFLLHPPIRVSEGDDLIVNFLMKRTKENHRLMEVELSYTTNIYTVPAYKRHVILSSSTARSSDEILVNLLPAAKSSPSVKSSATVDLPTYDSISDGSKKEVTPLYKSLGENAIHLIPLVLILCGLILWFSSDPKRKRNQFTPSKNRLNRFCALEFGSDNIAIMRYKKGNKVEVWSKNEVPSGSWHNAEIICGNGHNYTLRYDMYPGATDEAIVERVSRKSIRPCPPVVELSENWIPGDVVEVFQNFSWKMATVSKVLRRNCFLVRLLGSSQEFKVCKFDLRVRQSWQDDKWFIIGKGSGNCEDAKHTERTTLKYNQDLSSQNRRTDTTINLHVKDDSFAVKNNINCRDSCIVSSRTLKRGSSCCYSQVEALSGTAQKFRVIEKEGPSRRLIHLASKSVKMMLGFATFLLG